MVTGLANNPEIAKGDNGLIAEELVNFAETTCNSASHLRELGYKVTHGSCVLFYNNPRSLEALQAHGLSMINLFNLRELLDVAEEEKTHDARLIKSYREFLQDPLGWQKIRGLKPVEKGGTL